MTDAPPPSTTGCRAVLTDETTQVRQIWSTLGLRGVIDVHTHFMPKSVLDKVWHYFDSAGPLVGRTWPITYRDNESQRVNTLRQFGVRRFTALVYPHKPRMAAWLNQWSARFARYTPDCLATATFYPEPDAAEYVEEAIRGGAQIFKAHIQVGRYDPNDPLLDWVWGTIEDAGLPVVIHCGSGPTPGEHTGPEPIERLLHRYPRLRLIIAHMGMPEYAEFFDICERHPEVRLDTTMVFTSFAEETMPFPWSERHRLRQLGDRILFGSDFPNIPYGYLEAMRSLTRLPGIDDAWLRGVFYENAARLFDGLAQ
ncbi:amidohydrolase [Mycobacterium heckeshornense]|uniref:Amidohydrolase n=2 Tax=Mycobacterium heckeshornense TaxID=110505 RepID=A0A2G8BC42_9MYCO|nr:amidohydrolase family protein [Mycobacterium heckeshornense]KMV16821.1 amidohydrolase [Mycobacterium heckeshornense]MCV7035952.1 amidohydrolase [Mycobacterium heckeshornense]PIJ35242.1 amidohydrolase [Mycobacterium heckeshornense]BCO38102.1 amidohydrolase [Mycobacterium heckeshornense]BCQ10957.1 putative amidohydrolase [Mycobacterium heckeshornense]